MNKSLLALILFLPLLTFGQRSAISKKYPEVDWADLSSWPLSIENKGEKYTLVVMGGGGCIVYSPIEGRHPTEEEKKKWRGISAWYEPEGKKELGEYRIYGPYYRWNGADEIEFVRFSNGKNTIKQYDKNGELFRITKKNDDGYESYFYIGKFGREALEFRTKDDTYLQYRKPCSVRQFKDMKEQILKRFELHQPIDKYWP